MNVPGILPSRTIKHLVFVMTAIGAAGSVRASEVSRSDVTVMQQMIVEATRIDEGHGIFGRHFTWLYVAVPDCEILSRCDSEQTLAVARHIGSCLELNMGFVPDEYRAPLAVPMSFIMFNGEPTKALEAVLPESDEWAPRSSDFGKYFPRTESLEGGINTEDPDTHCTVQNRGGTRWMWAGGGSRGPIPTGTLFLLSRCAPALPLWYQYGFDGGTCWLERMMTLDVGLVIATASWISEDETKKILAEAKKTGTLPKLPPIEELFHSRGHTDGNSADARLSQAWMAEGALFLRWGLFGESEKESHRLAFSTFVERSRSEPVTEAMFRECFGFGYAEMQSRLSRYLISAVKEPICVDYHSIRHYTPHLNPNNPPFPGLDVREATPSEIARLLGDWERMQGIELRIKSPTLSEAYLAQAGKTLNKSYANGERDPRLLAVLGLYDYDVGEFGEAKRILMAATAAGVERPAAYIDLAQINLAEAKAHPDTSIGKLSANQTASVLKPLFEVRRKTRLDSKGYILIAEAWSSSAEKPSLPNLAVLEEGIGLYPFDSALALSAARTYALWGYATEAEALIDQRLKFTNDETATRLIELKLSLKTAK
jgi:hypothetical protein